MSFRRGSMQGLIVLTMDWTGVMTRLAAVVVVVGMSVVVVLVYTWFFFFFVIFGCCLFWDILGLDSIWEFEVVGLCCRLVSCL